jgi:uncharacterized membrane-anchored protein
MKLKLFILVLLLQSGWLVGMAIKQEYALAHGSTVLLETVPVDPRDLLSGDYVILSYKISSLPFKLFSPAITNDLPSGKTVYVALEKHGTFHEAVRASTNPIAPSPSQIVLKGHSISGWNHDDVRVEYGLERFYIHEGTGNIRGKLTAQVVVPDSGQGTVKQLFVDGKPFAEAVKQQSRTNTP